MLRWFRKKPAVDLDADPEVIAARAAQQRAHEAIRKVASQAPEVNQRVDSLEQRRNLNNFGRALEIAMEGRR